MPKNKYNKQCPFKSNGIEYIDYKDVFALRRYLSQYGRIVARYYSGVSLKNQKSLSRAIKRARTMALLPYTSKW